MTLHSVKKILQILAVPLHFLAHHTADNMGLYHWNFCTGLHDSAVQGHLSSMIMVAIESTYGTSF